MKNLRALTVAFALAGAVVLPGKAAAVAHQPDSYDRGVGAPAPATTTPGPLSMVFLATGLVGLMLVARRKKKQKAV